jgi:hypothetical protein
MLLLLISFFFLFLVMFMMYSVVEEDMRLLFSMVVDGFKDLWILFSAFNGVWVLIKQFFSFVVFCLLLFDSS